MKISRSFVNVLSLSRIGIALLFVLCFQRHAVLFRISVALCIMALGTDLLDGYIARRLKIASIGRFTGRHSTHTKPQALSNLYAKEYLMAIWRKRESLGRALAREGKSIAKGVAKELLSIATLGLYRPTTYKSYPKRRR